MTSHNRLPANVFDRYPPASVNTLATLSVVFAFVFAPVGAVLAHVGLSQIRRTGQRGRERALIGMSISYLLIVLAAVAVALALFAPVEKPSCACTPPAAPVRQTSAPNPGEDR